MDCRKGTQSGQRVKLLSRPVFIETLFILKWEKNVSVMNGLAFTGC